MQKKRRPPSKTLKPSPPDLVRVYVIHPLTEERVDYAVGDSFTTTPERAARLAELDLVMRTPPKASPKPGRPKPPDSYPLPLRAQEYLKELKNRGADPERLAMILCGYLPPHINAVRLHRNWLLYRAIRQQRTGKVDGRSIQAWRRHYDQLDQRGVLFLR